MAKQAQFEQITDRPKLAEFRCRGFSALSAIAYHNPDGTVNIYYKYSLKPAHVELIRPAIMAAFNRLAKEQPALFLFTIELRLKFRYHQLTITEVNTLAWQRPASTPTS